MRNRQLADPFFRPHSLPVVSVLFSFVCVCVCASPVMSRATPVWRERKKGAEEASAVWLRCRHREHGVLARTRQWSSSSVRVSPLPLPPTLSSSPPPHPLPVPLRFSARGHRDAEEGRSLNACDAVRVERKTATKKNGGTRGQGDRDGKICSAWFLHAKHEKGGDSGVSGEGRKTERRRKELRRERHPGGGLPVAPRDLERPRTERWARGGKRKVAAVTAKRRQKREQRRTLGSKQKHTHKQKKAEKDRELSREERKRTKKQENCAWFFSPFFCKEVEGPSFFFVLSRHRHCRQSQPRTRRQPCDRHTDTDRSNTSRAVIV